MSKKSFMERCLQAWDILVQNEPEATISVTEEPADLNKYTPMDPDDLGLGQFAVDKLTGIMGFICCRRDTISGMVQYAIQPRSTLKGFQTLTPEFTDWNNLEIYPNEDELAVVKPRNVDYPPIGSYVRDVVSGQEGVAVEKMIHLNGCVTIQCEYTTKDGDRRVNQIHNNRVELVEGKEPVKLPTLPEATPKGTGGFGSPMQKL